MTVHPDKCLLLRQALALIKAHILGERSTSYTTSTLPSAKKFTPTPFFTIFHLLMFAFFFFLPIRDRADLLGTWKLDFPVKLLESLFARRRQLLQAVVHSWN